MPPRCSTNFGIQKHHQNKPKFNGIYSRDNLSKIKDRAYVINLDEYSDIRTHWIALYVLNNVTFLIVLEWNIFRKKLNHLLVITTLKPRFLEYRHMIRYCVDIFVLDLLILCLQERL